MRGFQRKSASQRPSERQISSQRLSVLLPLIVLPLELSPRRGPWGMAWAAPQPPEVNLEGPRHRGDTRSPPSIGRTPRGSCNRTLLRRVLRRFSNSKRFLEGFLEGACRGFSVKTRFLEGFLEGSFSWKALRRCLEGRNTSFRRVRPPSRAP